MQKNEDYSFDIEIDIYVFSNLSAALCSIPGVGRLVGPTKRPLPQVVS